MDKVMMAFGIDKAFFCHSERSDESRGCMDSSSQAHMNDGCGNV